MSTAHFTPADFIAIFWRDELHLFFGAAFITIALISATLYLIRKRLDGSLLWLTVFAFLDGLRLWLQSDLLSISLHQPSAFAILHDVVNYSVPLPAIFFLRSIGLLKKLRLKVAYFLGAILLCLVAAVLMLGPLRSISLIYSVVMSAALIAFLAHLLTLTGATRDVIVIRRGLLLYSVLLLCAYAAAFAGWKLRIAPYGCAFLLGCLLFVAARGSFQKEQKFRDIEKELEIARRIQSSILPLVPPASDNFQIAARYVPMSAVAGDFYDFLGQDGRELGLFVADVSGHGVPAALIASMVKMAASSQRKHACCPATLLSAMNRSLCGNTQGQFVTAAYAYLDSDAQELRYSAAAHPPMLLLRDQVVTPIEQNGLMLALFPSADYSTAVQPLEAGDRLLLYTDGLIEATNTQSEEFGQARLSALFQHSAGMPPTIAVDFIVTSVQQWSKAQTDDLTIVLCDYRACSRSTKLADPV